MRPAPLGMWLLALLLVATGWPGAIAPAAAQLTDTSAPMDIGATGPNGHEIGARFTVTFMNGDYIGECTLEGQGDEPYPLSCRVVVPRGTTVVVTLDESSIMPGLAPVENPLSFDTSGDPGAASSWGVSFLLEPQAGNARTGQTSDIAIETFENGQPAYDACYILVDFSLEGCDRNSDGRVTFEDVPLGTYTVQQTADLGPGRTLDDFTITVTGALGSDGWEVFTATIVSSSSTTESTELPNAVDISLITRDPDDGHLLAGACYHLVGYGLERCDVDNDGEVTFEAIPYDTYTVHQTQTPAGYPAINDFEIFVSGGGMYEGPSLGIPQSFVVKQAPDQNAPNTRHVSIVFLDRTTHERITNGACVEIVGVSEVGCDQDLVDGQVDFLDVPEGGPYELGFSNLPAGSSVTGLNVPDAAVIVFAGEYDPTSSTFYAFVEQSGSNSDSGATASAEATMLMTFRGCPEGFDPEAGNFQTDCTIPLDAPDASVIVWGGDGQGGMEITGLDRQYDGAYIYQAGPQTMNIELSGLAPVLRDGYTVFGYDAVNGDTYTFNLVDGETREVSVFYYFDLAASGQGSGSSSSAQDGYDAMVGEWFGKRRDVILNADGTGIVEYRQDAFGNVLTYAVIVDPYTSPVTATIVDITTQGDIDLSKYPPVGHTVSLELLTHPDGLLLVVHMNHDGWDLTVCSVDNENNVQNMCY